MPRNPHFSQRRGERGQTIVLVAISILSLLAMAALAIDVVTLYVARSEVQRAADAAAVAGAKAMADSGITSLPPSGPNLSAAKTLANTMATAAINAVVLASPTINPVAGNAPTWVNSPLVITYKDPTGNNLVNNPQITVTLQQTNLPTFFARIWGSKSSTVTASATAEAYNPANMQQLAGSFTPIAPRCVKPWLVANYDPISGTPFITDTTNGTVETPTPIGEPFISLVPDCNSASSSTCSMINNPPQSEGANRVDFLPALVTPNPGNFLPACAGATDYERSIEGCDENSYQYLNCGGTGAPNAQWDTTVNPLYNNVNNAGVECLIGNGNEDTLAYPPYPTGPFQITAGSGPVTGQLVGTSRSIVTIPIIDSRNPIPASTVTVVGFLQAFITGVGGVGGNHVHVQILNVAGCGTTPNGAVPVVGGNGTSPVPVRLIHQ